MTGASPLLHEFSISVIAVEPVRVTGRAGRHLGSLLEIACSALTQLCRQLLGEVKSSCDDDDICLTGRLDHIVVPASIGTPGHHLFPASHRPIGVTPLSAVYTNQCHRAATF